MPELPEVETVRRTLEPGALGRLILNAELSADRISRPQDAQSLASNLIGKRINKLGRHGKLLILELDQGIWTVHLGMTGQLTLFDPQAASLPFHRQKDTGLQRTNQHPPDKHTHGIIELEHGLSIHYRDIRKFGKWGYYNHRSEIPELQAWGPDGLTLKHYASQVITKIKERSRSIKGLLLDQSIIAGIGNIYADEALYLAAIRPQTPGKKISKARLNKLLDAIVTVLEKGIRNQGTSLKDYVNSQGKKGMNQESLQVYGRGGENCYQCGSSLKKLQVAQRTTVYCSHCQS